MLSGAQKRQGPRSGGHNLKNMNMRGEMRRGLRRATNSKYKHRLREVMN